MLKLSTLLIKVSLTLAVLVAVATIGFMLVVASPPKADQTACALQDPYLSFHQEEEKTRIFVEATAPACQLGIPEGTTFRAILGSGDGQSVQETLAQIQLNNDGSNRQELPINVAELADPAEITVIGSAWTGPECEAGNSCAVLTWNLKVQPASP